MCLKFAMNRVSSFGYGASHAANKVYVDFLQIKQICAANDIVYTLEEETAFAGFVKEMRARFELYFVVNGTNTIAEMRKQSEKLVEELKSEGLQFLQYESPGSLHFLLDVDSEENNDMHVPSSLLFVERLYDPAIGPPKDQISMPPVMMELKKVDADWKNINMDSLKRERQQLISHQKETMRDFIGDSLNFGFSLETVEHYAVAMNKMLPWTSWDDDNITPLELRHKKNLTEKDLKELAAIKKAYDFHRLDIFCEVFKTWIPSSKEIIDYLEDGTQQYKRRNARRQMKHERSILEDRFVNAWNSRTNIPEDPSNIAARLAPTPIKPKEISVKDVVQKLLASGEMMYPRVDVFCLTPLTEDELKSRKERRANNLNAIKDYFAPKDEPTTPPIEETAPAEPITASPHHEGEHNLIRVFNLR
jgi:hypothetical protein